MSTNGRGENPWSDMPQSEVDRNIMRAGGAESWWSRERAWGRSIMFASATIGIIAYLAKKTADGRILPPSEECDDDFDLFNPSTYLGGYCDSVINGRSEAVYTPQVSNHIDPEEMVIVGSEIGFVIGLLLFLWGSRSHKSTSTVAA